MSDRSRSTSRRSRTRLDPEERRLQIVDAAIRAFADKDPAEVSFEAVAETAGVSRSLVYSYFGDRGHLFAAAYTRSLAVLDECLERDLTGVSQPRRRLTVAMRTYLEFARDRHEYWNVIVNASTARHTPVREAVAERSVLLAHRLGDDSEGALLVSGVMGMLDAAANHMVEHGTEVDELADMLSQVVWSGISSLETERAVDPGRG